MIVFSFFKLLYFLRIYENFSHLVSMLESVLQDLRVFLAFFSFVVITFSLILMVQMRGNKEGEEVFILESMLMAFRTSVGDNEMEFY
jgi:hypothetical protein